MNEDYTCIKKFAINESIPSNAPITQGAIPIWLTQEIKDYNKDTFNIDRFRVDFPKLYVNGNDFLKIMEFMASIGVIPVGTHLIYENDNQRHCSSEVIDLNKLRNTSSMGVNNSFRLGTWEVVMPPTNTKL